VDDDPLSIERFREALELAAENPKVDRLQTLHLVWVIGHLHGVGRDEQCYLAQPGPLGVLAALSP
jgi:hypothetical protein